MKLKMPKKVVIAATLALAIVGAAGWYAYQVMYGATRAIAQAVVAPEPERPIIKFGLNLADFKVLNHVVKQNEFFADILSQYNVTYPTVDLLARAGKEILTSTIFVPVVTARFYMIRKIQPKHPKS